MAVWDFLKYPYRGIIVQADEDVLQRIVVESACANIALLWLHLTALISHRENDVPLDRLERVGRLQRGAIRELKYGLPEEWRTPLTAA